MKSFESFPLNPENLALLQNSQNEETLLTKFLKEVRTEEHSEASLPEISHKRIGSTSTTRSIYVDSEPCTPLKLQDSDFRLLKQSLKRPVFFNILIAGDSKLGKTSFINTFLSMKFNKFSGQFVDEEIHPTLTIRHNRAMKQEKDIQVELDFIDTPGYGEFPFVDNWLNMLVEFIIQQAKLYKQEKQTKRKSKLADTRVHLCLFFLGNTRCKERDLHAMHTLQNYLPVIPVIAKADCYLPEELKNAKLEVLQQCFEALIKTFDCGQCLGARANELSKTPLSPSPPFCVFSAEAIYNHQDKAVYGRKNQSGVYNIEDLELSDFALLKKFLIGSFLPLAVTQSKALITEALRKRRLKHLKTKSKKRSNELKGKLLKSAINIVGKFVASFF